MFEQHKEKVAQQHYQQALTQWQQHRDAQAALLVQAQSFAGETASTTLLLGPDEHVYATVTGAGLIEERAGRGHYVGGSSGVSVPIGSLGGHAVRYHVGATRGHYVTAPPSPTAIDTGALTVTDRRVVFQGGTQTRECLFAQLIGYQHGPDSTTFSVSNRQKPTVVHYGPDVAGWFDFRLDLALAHFRGTLAALVGQLTADLGAIDAARPVPPAVSPAAT